MQLNFETSLKGFAKKLKRVQRSRTVPLAVSSSINKTLAKANTQAKRRIVGQAGVPQNVFKNNFKTFKASKSKMTGKLWIGLKYGRRLESLSAGQRKKFWRALAVVSPPFRATMKSGHRSTFARVARTTSRKGTKGWTPGRAHSSERNLPIVDLERATVRLDENFARLVVTDLGKSFVPKEFSRTFRREINNRLKRLGL